MILELSFYPLSLSKPETFILKASKQQCFILTCRPGLKMYGFSLATLLLPFGRAYVHSVYCSNCSSKSGEQDSSVAGDQSRWGGLLLQSLTIFLLLLHVVWELTRASTTMIKIMAENVPDSTAKQKHKIGQHAFPQVLGWQYLKPRDMGWWLTIIYLEGNLSLCPLSSKTAVFVCDWRLSAFEVVYSHVLWHLVLWHLVLWQKCDSGNSYFTTHFWC